MKKMNRWLYFLAALALYFLIHENLHALISSLFNEFDALRWHWYGPEVIYMTSVEDRTPEIKWFFISGVSNFVTLAIGYVTFLLRNKIIVLKSALIKNFLFYLAVVFLLCDAVNLSMGPFIYGGDAPGIAAGLNIKLWMIQIFFGIVLLINRELIATLMKLYGIRSGNILFKPWRRD